MFVHLVKDFLKKLEDVEKRLEVSLDRDEIQTLGLKLRFYYSEIRHYQNLFKDIQAKIIGMQEKFGFKPEDGEDLDTGKKATLEDYADNKPEEKEASDSAVPEKPHSAEPKEDPAELVSSWISKMEEKGVDPREVLSTLGKDVLPDDGRDFGEGVPASLEQELKPAAGERGEEPSKSAGKFGMAPGNVSSVYKQSVKPEEEDLDHLEEALAETGADSVSISGGGRSARETEREEAETPVDKKLPGGATLADLIRQKAADDDWEDTGSTGQDAGRSKRSGALDITVPAEGPNDTERLTAVMKEADAMRDAGDVLADIDDLEKDITRADEEQDLMPEEKAAVEDVSESREMTLVEDADDELDVLGGELDSSAGTDTDIVIPEPEPVPPAPASFDRKLLGFADEMQSAVDTADTRKMLDQFFVDNKADVAEWMRKLSAAEAAGFFSGDDSGVVQYAASYLAKKAGKSGTSINWTEESLKKSGFRIQKLTLLGDLYYQKRIFGKALECYKKAEEKGERTQYSGIGVIRCSAMLSQYDDVIKEVGGRRFTDAGLRLEALYYKSQALVGIEKFEEATGLMVGLLETAASPGWQARFAFLLAKLRERVEDIAGAIEYYEQSIEFDNRNPEMYFALGRLYLEHKAYPLAKSNLMTIIKKFPESPWADKARELLYQEGVL